jgi:hypothetical protein
MSRAWSAAVHETANWPRPALHVEDRPLPLKQTVRDPLTGLRQRGGSDVGPECP